MKDVRFAKFLILVNCAVPGVLLAWDAFHHRLGANPVKFAILTTGMLTLIFLMLTLLVTPIRKITGWNSLIFSRRTLGLYAFFYGSTHFLIFFALERGFSVSGTVAEMFKRPYLVIGSAGLVSMIPLALTSTNAAVKRLGAKRWQLLHRLAYVAAAAGVVHFYMQAKADKRQPIAFAAAVGFLLGYRLVRYIGDKQKNGSNRTDGTNGTNASGLSDSPLKPKFWSGPLRVARIVQETHNVKTFRLESVDGGALPFEHQPGQHMNLSLQIEGRRVNRSYTIASPPTRRAHCELTIKREEMGVASRHLHDTLREGDLLSVGAPAGKFTFSGPESEGIVLIAGGVGITPLMAIVRALTDRAWKGDIYFFVCVRNEQEIIFERELKELAKRFANLKVCVTLSRPERVDWGGRCGRITPELLSAAVPNLGQRPCYVCGPEEMMGATTKMLRELGVPESRIQLEAFVYPAKAEAGSAADQMAAKAPGVEGVSSVGAATFDPGESGPPSVTFSVSGKTVPLSPAQTILEAGESVGLDLAFECRSGICGTCKTRLLAGSVTMDVQDALSSKDKADNMILLCQAKAAQPVTVQA